MQAMSSINLDIGLERKLKYMAAQRAIPVGTLVEEALGLGLQQIERRSRSRVQGKNDACSVFAQYLRDAKGYAATSSRTISSLARSAVQTGDLDTAAGAHHREKGTYGMKRAVTLWRGFCAENDHHELSLEWDFGIEEVGGQV